MKCPLCGREMKVIGYITIIGGFEGRGGQSSKVPAKWRCPYCGVIIDAT